MNEHDKGVTRDPALRGYLVIYVDGYKMRYKHLVHVFADGKDNVCVPDRLMPPPDHEIGSDEWWHDGWAIGDNLRGRLCKRFGVKPLRRFKHFDEAVAFVYQRQRKHKSQRHTLVYATTGAMGKERLAVIRSLDDIDAIEAGVAAEIAASAAASAADRARRDADFPHLQALQDKHGFAAGLRLSCFLKDINDRGAKAVKASMPPSSYYRQIKQLREAGVDSRERPAGL